MERALAAGGASWLAWVRTQRREHLNEAFHAIVTALMERPGSPQLAMVAIGLNIELGNLEAAQEQLDVQAAYRGHYRANAPASYAQLLYLRSVLSRKRLDTHEANKALRALDDYARQANPAKAVERGLVYALLGAAYLSANRLKEAFDMLEQAHATGWRGPFLFAKTYMLLRQRRPVASNSLLVTHTLHWAVRQGFAVGELLEFHADTLHFPEEPAYVLYAALLGECKADWLVRRICARVLEAGDSSRQAYEIYSMAQRRQIQLDGLEEAVVRTAFALGREDIPRHAMRGFLQNIDGAEPELAAFVHHILLSSRRFVDMADIPVALAFALSSHEKCLGGRYANSLYRCLLEEELDKKGCFRELQPLADALERHILCWELEVGHPEAHTLWVRDPSFGEARAYRVVEGSARVSACGNGFVCHVFSEKGLLLETDVVRTRVVSRPGPRLLGEYFRQGSRDQYLVAALASHYAALAQDPQLDPKTISSRNRIELENGLNVLAIANKLPGLSVRFGRRVLLGLGMCLAGLGRRREAALVFKRVVQEGEGLTRSRYVLDTLLRTLAEQGHLDTAIRLAEAGFEGITQSLVFRFLKGLLQDDRAAKLDTRAVSKLAYAIMMRSWFDKQFVDFVLQYHRATHLQWMELADTLRILGEEHEGLYVKVLVGMQLGIREQRALARFSDMSPGAPIIAEYIYLCAYEAAANGFVPERTTLGIMEGIFRNTGDNRLAYALISAYTAKGQPSAEEALLRELYCHLFCVGILHPNFSGVGEGWPLAMLGRAVFVHRATPARDVYLHYRVLGEMEEFLAMRMEYAFFGIYTCHMGWFYGERIEYYFSESTSAGSVDSARGIIANTGAHLREGGGFVAELNNTLIYEGMFRYDKVEEFLELCMRDDCKIAAQLL